MVCQLSRSEMWLEHAMAPFWPVHSGFLCTEKSVCVLGKERVGGWSTPGFCLVMDLEHGWGAHLELGAHKHSHVH